MAIVEILYNWTDFGMKKYLLFTVLIVVQVTNSINAATIKYQFDIEEKTVNFTGKSVTALAINNQIPGPTIEATVGDILEVTFVNKMGTATSIHWHGILLPNDQDGVPYLTTPPIAPHSSFTYSYTVIQSGTYWYHSHTGLQEQRGIYGALIFHPKNGESIKTDHDHVVVLSEWTNENPKKILSHLKRDGDYYALKKNTVQSWDKVIKNGFKAIKNRFSNALSRMGPMDLSDIGYDIFLLNGKQKSNLKIPAGKTIRLRLINAGASSYFNVEFAGGPMTIVSSDGIDVEPILVQRLHIAIAETYDVIISTTEQKAYEFRATAEDGTGSCSIFIGQGETVFAPDIPKPNLFLMDSKHEKSHNIAHPKHFNITKDTVIDYMNNYQHLRSIKNTNFSDSQPKREISLNLTGNMDRYTWAMDHKTLLESRKILIHKDEIVRLSMNNQTMMHHPMHLHGHFFRVLNGQENKSPLKHTVDVPSMDKVIIEFEADKEKDWFFHCHNLYHLNTGMGRVVSYKNTTKATRKTFTKFADDSWYYNTDFSILSNMTMGTIRAENTRNAFEIVYDYNYEKEYDLEAVYIRNLTLFLDLYVGGNFERTDLNKKPEDLAIFGVHYILPLLIELDLRIDSQKKFRLELSSDLQLTKRFKFEWFANTDEEFQLNLGYELNKKYLLQAIYDSDFKWGIGLRIKL